MSTHARPLAEWLSAASDAELATLFAARRVRPDAGWHDYFDAAEALLDTASVNRILPALTHAEELAAQRVCPSWAYWAQHDGDAPVRARLSAQSPGWCPSSCAGS